MSLDATINFGNVVGGSAAKPGAINVANIYARWVGYLVPSVSGKYTLGCNSNDGVNLFINDTPILQLLASALTANGTTSYNNSGTIELTAGMFYPITLEWQHGAGTTYQIQLLWTPPGGSVAVIPSANLSTSRASITGNLTGAWWNGTAGLWFPAGPGMIDFVNANHVNKNQDNVTDGTTLKRVANVNADNTFHVSTSLNAQASVLPNQVVLISLSMPSATVLISTWLTQSLNRPDNTALSVPTSAGANLVTNGDMESGTLGSQETSWTLSVGNGLITANDFVHSGSKAAKIAGATTSVNLGQTISVTAGQVYVIEGWLKCDAQTGTLGTHAGVCIDVTIVSGVTSFSIITKFGAYDAGNPTLPKVALPPDGVARGYTFLQCYFKPTANGVVQPRCIVQNTAGTGWFDDFKVYAHSGIAYSGLTASGSYYLYSYIDAVTGQIMFANGNPPPTSPSDTLAQQCTLDGRIALPSKHITMPTAGGSGSDTGGGSGTCPEFDAPVFVRRYSRDGVLIFEGTIKAGDVEPGFESDDGETKRGDFLKGYSFKQQADVYRAVQHFKHVPCAGWMRIDDIRFTACETVWDGPFDAGQWLPAWRVPGAIHDSTVGLKVLIQVEADWDDEHNFYAGSRLIHNTPVLPC